MLNNLFVKVRRSIFPLSTLSVFVILRVIGLHSYVVSHGLSCGYSLQCHLIFAFTPFW